VWCDVVLSVVGWGCNAVWFDVWVVDGRMSEWVGEAVGIIVIVRGGILRRLSMFILSWRKQGLVIARATRLENDVGSAFRQSAWCFR